MFQTSILTVLVATSLAMAPREDLTESRYNELKELFSSETDKPWRSIDWKISLIDAQNAAAEQGKPIFIWAMDGHPLGCT